jgi:AbrB family looped-hinge helix DNA binding protein
MATSSVTSKGQITLPISVRKKLRLNSGDLVEFVEGEDGEFTVKAKKGDLMEFYGFIKRTGKPLTIEEMDDAIAAHLGEDDARIKREYAAHQKRSGK